MRFSIRELLALGLLFALSMLAWRTRAETKLEEDRSTQLQQEIETLGARVRLDNPALHQAMVRSLDDYQSLHAMRERAVAQFTVIRDKYSSLEPRAAGSLSLRGVPSLQTESGPAPVVFRLLIPQQRSVWLKFGVHAWDQPLQSSEDCDAYADFITESPFQLSGPFQQKLDAGDQTLSIAIGYADQGSLPLVISLDDKILLRTAYVMDNVSGASWSSISGSSQLDFAPGRELPGIMTARLGIRDPEVGNKRASVHGFSFWLSDQSSDFAAFPGT